MPYKSAKQRRYIHMKAEQGEAWAKKFVRDAEKGKHTKKGKKKRKRGKA